MSPLKLGRRAAEPTLTERDQRVVWRIAALLLDYPAESTLAMLDDLRAAAASADPRAGEPLVSFVDHARSTAPMELAQHYVETFDLRRRSCLHLTYYAYGDTRKRGMALLRFKHAYRQAGVELDDRELPDHLSVVLEFAATADPHMGRRLLVEHRPVIELLRLSLLDSGSPYVALLDAVSATLPPLNVADRRRIAELAAQGPPDEDVGLEPYAMDPSLQPDTWSAASEAPVRSGGCS
ncbi:MAG: nitrate reductase molybdenum cofactor assembly chaperone [Thermocrispum sp.]